MATAADAERIAAVTAEGFESYRSFAPAGWEPPPQASARDMERIDDPESWCLVAERGGELAGHVVLLPAERHPFRPVPEPETAHLGQLFVRPRLWGSGLAARLHEAALAEAAARGYTGMRLFTPAGQTRARRFYEREGWSAAGEPFHEDRFGFPILEYRRPLGASSL
jgi:GNAT superfamily N-acetyltransferase